MIFQRHRTGLPDWLSGKPPDPSSPWSTVIDNVDSAGAIIDFLREEWEERPVDIGLSIVASLP